MLLFPLKYDKTVRQEYYWISTDEIFSVLKQNEKEREKEMMMKALIIDAQFP